MPRIARVVLPGYPHHIVQRGHNRQTVFIHEDDFVLIPCTRRWGWRSLVVKRPIGRFLRGRMDRRKVLGVNA